MHIDLTLSSVVSRSAKVVQVESMFDVPASEKSTVHLRMDAPIEDREWSVGLIVGPSGAGKSSVAKAMFGDAVIQGFDWDDRSVVDNFPLGARETTDAMCSVGFSSPPSWLRPHSVLSTGEKFRCDLARALVDPRPLVVMDEFTSVVDRVVARVASHSVAKAVRARNGKQFVAVTCHDDVEDWLQPDWVLEPHAGLFRWRSLRRRPSIELEIVRASRDSWAWFSAHHYLTADLPSAARCFVGLIDGRPACFAGVLAGWPHPVNKNLCSLSRLVVHPDFQGLGLGARGFTEQVARVALSAIGKRLRVGAAHPALIKAWSKSPLWRQIHGPDHKVVPNSARVGELVGHTSRWNRRVASYVWSGDGAADVAAAKSLWGVAGREK